MTATKSSQQPPNLKRQNSETSNERSLPDMWNSLYFASYYGRPSGRCTDEAASALCQVHRGGTDDYSRLHFYEDSIGCRLSALLLEGSFKNWSVATLRIFLSMLFYTGFTCFFSPNNLLHNKIGNNFSSKTS